MRAGMKLNENDLLYYLSCERCKGRVVFSASVSRKDAVTKLLVNHNWTNEKNKLLCDGCSGMLDEDRPKKKSKKSKPNKQPKPEIKPSPKVEELEEDEDGYVDL